MSIKRMTAVFECSRQRANLRLLVLAIADNANDNGHAWPGTKLLASKTFMSERTVMRCIETVEVKSNELMVYRRQGRVNHYLVLTGFTREERIEAIEAFCEALEITFADLAQQRNDAVVRYVKCHQRPVKPQTRDKMTPVLASENGKHTVRTTDKMTLVKKGCQNVTGDTRVTTTPDTLSQSGDTCVTRSHEPSFESSDSGADAPARTLTEWLAESVTAIKQAVNKGLIFESELSMLLEREKSGLNNGGRPRSTLVEFLEARINPATFTAAQRDAMAEALAGAQGLCMDIMTKDRRKNIGICAGQLLQAGYQPSDVPRIKAYMDGQNFSGYTERAFVKYAPNIRGGTETSDPQIQSALERTRSQVYASGTQQ